MVHDSCDFLNEILKQNYFKAASNDSVQSEKTAGTVAYASKQTQTDQLFVNMGKPVFTKERALRMHKAAYESLLEEGKIFSI